MKKLTFYGLFLTVLLLSIQSNAQQLNNSGFENWENLGQSTEKPNDWNSFKNSSGTLSSFASQQIIRSALTRPGTSGSYSAAIWSKEIIGVVANGNVTTGQINMGNMTPVHADNYNITHTANPVFSEALGASPDSLVFWARFKPSNAGGNDSARLSAIIHDNYDLRDPQNANSLPHIVASAVSNFPSNGSQWTRYSIPFIYIGPATSPDFILVTFTTNKTPGGGSGGDSLFIDDVSLIYNSSSMFEQPSENEFFASVSGSQLLIQIPAQDYATSVISIYNAGGQKVYSSEASTGKTNELIDISNFTKGIYIVDVITGNHKRYSQKVVLY